MKTSTFLLALGAAVTGTNAINADPLSFGAFLDPTEELAKRQAAPDNGQIIANALYSISNGTQALGNQISHFTVDGLVALSDASLAAVAVIYAGLNNVSAIQGNLTIAEALPLTTVVPQLAGVVNNTLDLLIDKKVALGGAAFVVQTALGQQYNATEAISLAILSKIPPTLQTIASSLTLPIFSNLTNAMNVYAVPNVNPPSVYAVSAAPALAGNLFVVALVPAFVAVVIGVL